MNSTARTGPRRRWRIALLAASIAATVLILALPELLSRSIARHLLVSGAARVLAPGSLEAAVVRVSWLGPTEVRGVVLRDGEGSPLVVADRATLDWNLLQIVFRRPETATLRLPGASLEVRRGEDGRIDLYETLRPIIREHPRHRLVIEIPDGRLRFRDASLAEPIAAQKADIRLDVPRDPDPITWDVTLVRDVKAGPASGRVVSRGTVHRPGDGGASLSIEASRWPWALAAAGDAGRGELDGRLSAERRDGQWVVSAEAMASSPYARIDGRGTIESRDGVARVDLKGSLAPDWERIQADLRHDVEPRARIAGRAGDWRLSGTMGSPGDADRFEKLAGELGLRLDALEVYGLRLSGTSVKLRSDGDRLRLDPIDARLNDGALHLEPAVIRPESGPIRIKLGAASTLQDAVVDDEVSHRVLSYVAPVLDGATRVRGRISVRGLDAEFPLGEKPGTSTRVQGDVVFDDVRFLPGPLAEAIVELVPRAAGVETGEGPMLALRDPISFRIADRKVYQRGLSVPIGRVGSVGMEGSVDFEKRLDLVARFRINPPGADRPVLAALLNGARFELPIRGTLSEPRIDQEELKQRLGSVGTDMLENSIAAGAGGLLRLLDGLPRRREARKPPADATEPPPPPRPSAEDRRELREQRRLDRMEKKAQRRARRDGTPE